MLFSVQDYKTRFRIRGTAQDDQIDVLRRSISAMCEAHCNREFEYSGNEETEYLDGDGTPIISVRKPPIAAISALYIDPGRAFGTDSLVPAANYEILAGGRKSDQGLIRLLDAPQWMPTSGSTWEGYFPDVPRSVKVVYSGGFTSIPLDLKEAAMRWAFSLSGREPGVTSLTIGSYSVSYAQGSKDSAVPPDIRAMLSPYVRIGSRRRI